MGDDSREKTQEQEIEAMYKKLGSLMAQMGISTLNEYNYEDTISYIMDDEPGVIQHGRYLFAVSAVDDIPCALFVAVKRWDGSSVDLVPIKHTWSTTYY